MTRVLLVDADDLTQGLRSALLQFAGFIVTASDTIRGASDTLAGAKVDIVVIECAVDPERALADVLRRWPNAKLVAIVRSDLPNRVASMCDRVLTAPALPMEIIDAVCSLAKPRAH